MSPVRQTSAFLLFAAAAACSPPSSTVDAGGELSDTAASAAGPLVDHSQWSAESTAEDAFGDLAPAEPCERGVGWEVEEFDGRPALGVETDACNPFVGAHPIAMAIAAGTTLRVRIWHYALVGDGEAHVGIALDDAVVWDRRVTRPSDSGALIEEEFVAPTDYPAGAALQFHLHNHGINSFNLLGVEALEK